jgi:hypothetical protein
MIAAFPNSPFNFAPAPGGDPDFASVGLLAHMNGTNGGTTFTDSSSSAHTITANGNAQTSTAQSKFNGSSGLFDGTGDFLSIPASSDFDYGTGDFTVEWFCRFTSVSGFQYFFDIGSNGTFVRLHNGTTLLAWATTATILSATIAPLSAGQWYYMALTRTGTAWKFWIDGTTVATGTDARAAGSSASALRIGDYGGGGYGFNGHMAEFRSSKILRDVSTVPAGPFSDS